MRAKVKLYSIIIICGIIIGILVPVLLLTGRQADNTPPNIIITSPTSKTYISQVITVNFTTTDSDVQTIWYRIHNDTAGTWVDLNNLTWSSPIQRSLGQGGVYTLYVWANDTQGHTSTESVVFTMIHEIIITGNHVFATDFVVTLYQKVIFQDGEFTFTAGDLVVLGTLEMHNVTFHGNLTAEGVVIMENVTVNSQLIFIGDSIATIQNAQINCNITAYNNALVSIANSGITKLISFMNALISVESSWANSLVLDGNSSISANNLSAASLITCRKVVASLNLLTISGMSYLRENSDITLMHTTLANRLWIYENVKLTIENASLKGASFNDNCKVNITAGFFGDFIYTYGNSELNLTSCTTTLISFSDSSIATLRNHTAISNIYVQENATLTLIDSNTYDIYTTTQFESGNWTVDYNKLSGNGTYQEPTLTLINTNSQSIYTEVYTLSYSNVFIYNSQYDNMFCHEQSNVNLYNTSVFRIDAYEDSNLSVYNSTISVLSVFSNQTVYLENVTGLLLTISFQFQQGNIFGYNHTFTGVQSGTNPNVIIGPNVDYNNIKYAYFVYNQVNLALINTTKIQFVYPYNDANVSLHFCNMDYSDLHDNANLTLYHTTVGDIYAYDDNNVTLFNSTITYRLWLEATSFGYITDFSQVNQLILYGSSGYWYSADSKISSVSDNRP